MVLKSGLIRLGVSIAIVLLTLLEAGAGDDTRRDPMITNIGQDIETLVRRHYPEARMHQTENVVRFDFDTQPFSVHIPLKTGEWQEAREMRGPKKGGILGSVELSKGKYEGAAMLPQTFDHCYFSEMVSAPYSKACDCYLYVHLSVPPVGRNQQFIREFHDLVNSVERWQECDSVRPVRGNARE